MKSFMPQRYTIANPPSLNTPGFIIEQDFLRHIITGVIPNLKGYLTQLNADDWTCLLAENPREEFFKFLTQEMIDKIHWDYVTYRQKWIETLGLKKVA